MQLPAVLKPFKNEGEKLLEEGKVKQIEFSHSTYQVQVTDSKNPEGVWAFIQLNDHNKLKDFFCSCDEGDMGACSHVTAAYLKIFDNHKAPLHKRFEKSLWNKLCFLLSEEIHFDPTQFKPSKKGIYSIYSADHKLLFMIHAMNKQTQTHLNDIIFNRPSETEETSLKFSNLPQDEIALWKEGRPSSYLRYELSFWSDLAKWLMSLQDENKDYVLDFEYDENQVPNVVKVEFKDLLCKFYLTEENLAHIIPALNTVHSPLPLHHLRSNNITNITFDKNAGALLINAKNESNVIQANTHQLEKRFGSWLYVPKKGFYPLDPFGLTSSQSIKGFAVSTILNQNLSFVKTHHEDFIIHDETFLASYHLSFDSQWNLHIDVYALEPGDLSQQGSFYFGDWIYLKDDGFYKFENQRFNEVNTIILAEDVGEFVQNNRTWLNGYDGFETHITSLESQLTYTMETVNGPLSFQRLISNDGLNNQAKDFGPWIYIAGQGFYSKVTSQVGVPFKPGITLIADQIAMFIRSNRFELNLVPQFFSKDCPVAKASLEVFLDKNDQIVVSPLYELHPKYKNLSIGFFDEFAYVAGEGFSELSLSNRLPINYRHSVYIEPKDQTLFLNYELNHLKPFISKVDKRLELPVSLELVAHNIQQADENKKGWYNLKLSYKSSLGEVHLNTLWSALKKKQRFCFSEAGLIDFDDRRFDWIRLLPKKRLEKSKQTILLSTIELIRLNASESIKILEGKDQASSTKLLKELVDFEIPEPANLTGFPCQLRPYQQLGLNWLWFLYHHGLSGLLADDMGLGKTHQAMALFSAILNNKKNDKKEPSHFLVVAPTSVLYHWQDKLAQYLPQLRVCTFYGSDRNLDEFHEQYDILLTSYGVWRIEHAMLSEIPFEVAIFDEIQIAKNHNSRLYASLTQVNAQMRLGLTGTPIENHLRELKALFDLVLPHYMPSDKDFKNYFVRPIEKERNPEKKQLLSRLIHPFVLRRKKEDVLLDLPEKTEEIAHCGLSEQQADLYNQVLIPSRRIVFEELEHQDQPIPYIHVFSILSALKQICDHPACFLKKPHEYKNYESGKWNLFIELLEEARESKQKVVVFSQYLNMLDIIQYYLNERGIQFASIRGSTTDRGEQLKKFNQNPDCEVFLGSLQATGLGVELTAASVVIHYDRWWNAARENQATDRVHRIGQKRGVQVFKMVTKGTFEEKIDAMITRKGQLMEDVVGVDDHRILKNFSRDDIIDLLQNAMPS